MANFKKMLFGEKMPDKDDPQYRERYEKEVSAGMKFARATRLDKVAARVQNFANLHTKAFLIIVFGFVILCFTLNMYRIIAVSSYNGKPEHAVERQEQMLRKKRVRPSDLAISAQQRVSTEQIHQEYE